MSSAKQIWVISLSGMGNDEPIEAFDNADAAINSFVDKGGEFFRIDRIELKRKFIPCNHVFVLNEKHYCRPMMACEKCTLLKESFDEYKAREDNVRKLAVREAE